MDFVRTYRRCDLCHKAMHEHEQVRLGIFRPLMGETDPTVEVVVCKDCKRNEDMQKIARMRNENS